jgi:hypothetical protein
MQWRMIASLQLMASFFNTLFGGGAEREAADNSRGLYID